VKPADGNGGAELREEPCGVARQTRAYCGGVRLRSAGAKRGSVKWAISPRSHAREYVKLASAPVTASGCSRRGSTGEELPGEPGRRRDRLRVAISC